MDHCGRDQNHAEDCGAPQQPRICGIAHMSVAIFFSRIPRSSLSGYTGRNKEYLELACRVTTDIVFDGFLLNLCPDALKP